MAEDSTHSGRYGTHADYMTWVEADADERREHVETALREAFSSFIHKQEVDIVVFSSMTALELADAIIRYPLVLKPLLAATNIAARAIERDLSIKNLDTYEPKLDRERAQVIAGYVKPFLPPCVPVPALGLLDRTAFVDKEIRKRKGQWEKRVIQHLTRVAGVKFGKRMFETGGEQFELDAAMPASGDVKVGVDIKRIEARRDIHKRCDEIVNKATKLKSCFPGAKFAAVIYYPFVEEHVNIQNRLRSEDIDGVVFASEGDQSIENAVRMLLAGLRL